MAITRTPIIDDDGSGETGTSLDNAWKQEFYNQIDGAIATGAAPLPLFSRFGTRTSPSLALDTYSPVAALPYSASLRVTVQVTQLNGAGTTLYLTVSGVGIIVALHDLCPGGNLAVWSSSIWQAVIKTAGQNSNTLACLVSGSGVAAPGTVTPTGHVTVTSFTGLNWPAGGWALGLEGAQAAGASQHWAWQAERIG